MPHLLTKPVAASALLLLIAASTLPDLAISAEPLSVKKIYSESDFRSKSYSARWAAKGDRYLRLEKNELVAYEASTGDRRVLISQDDLTTSTSNKPLTISGYQFSKDQSQVLLFTNTRKVWRYHTRGDYWVFDRATRTLQQVGTHAAPSSLMFAKFSPDGQAVAYVVNKRLYVEDVRDQAHRLLTNDADSNMIYGTSDWVYEEEFGVRDGFRWSPDGKLIALWAFDTSRVKKFSLVNQTDGLYPKRIDFHYPKVGQRNSVCKIGVLEVASGRLDWLPLPEDGSAHYVPRIYWRPDSSDLIVQSMDRLQQNNQLILFDAVTGRAKRTVSDHDDAWIDVHNEVYWSDDARYMSWISERSGWRQAERIDWTTGARQPLTSTEFDAAKLIHMASDESNSYFAASPTNSTQRYLYAVSTSSDQAVRVTPKAKSGYHDYAISASGQYAIHTYSSLGVPTKYELVSLPDHRVVRVLEDNAELSQQLGKLKPIKSEFVKLRGADGDPLDAWLMYPQSIAKGKKVPLIVYVYGEPAGQTTKDRWGGSSYLWHRMMVERGYAVATIDNRGTPSPLGRAWRKSVYRHVGIIAPKDQAAGVESLLKQKRFLDPKRVGVWGWSGGGSMTLNAMFKYPKLYKVGISIAPVPNQRYYDTIYQERYMGLPGDNVEGYTEGSPVHHAKNLEGKLLLVHGTGDDNCHYQGMELLINELIRHNKVFDMMAYPNRSHSINEGKNTSLHLRELMTRFFQTHL